MTSISPEARNGVPRTDDSAGALMFGLVLVLAAVAWVAWHYGSRLLSPGEAPTTIPEPVASSSLGGQPTTLMLTTSGTFTAYAFDPSFRWLIPQQNPLPASGDALGELRAYLDTPIPAPGTERLMPGTTTLRDLRREGSMAIVDLPQEALDLLVGETAKQSFLEALTRSVTSIPGIDKAQFMVEGKRVEVTEDGVMLDHPWTVENALNPAESSGAGNSGEFWFLDATQTWLVPLTLRYVSGASPLESKLRRLMEGPPPSSGGLVASMPAQLGLQNLKYDPETEHLTVAFTSNDPPQAWGLYKPVRLIHALVLTLQEIVPIRNLTVTINDQDIWSVATFASVEERAAEISLFNIAPTPAG